MEKLDKTTKMMICRPDNHGMKIHIVLILVVFLCIISGFTLSAQEQATMSPTMIDQALAAKNIDRILEALNLETTDEDKAASEAKVLAEAKNLVFNGNLDLASKYAETVLLFDFMNNDAQDLYLSIEDQKKASAKLEEKKKQEADLQEQQRLKAEEDKKILAAQQELKAEEEQQAREEKAFLESVQSVGIQNFSFNAEVSPSAAALLYSSDFANSYIGTATLQKGLRVPAGVGLRFTHPYVIASAKGFFGLTIVPFNSAEKLMDYSGRLSVGTPLTGLPLCITGGLAHYGFLSASGGSSSTVLVTDITSPTIGLSLENVRITSSIDITVSAQWLAASIKLTPSMAAFMGEVSGRFLFGNPSTTRFYISPSITGYVTSSSSGTEWICTPALYAGVLIHDYR